VIFRASIRESSGLSYHEASWDVIWIPGMAFPGSFDARSCQRRSDLRATEKI
jgi:hypothetical protein